MYMNYIKRSQNQGPNENRKEKEKYKDKKNIKSSSSGKRGVSIWVVLRWLNSSIVLYVDVF